MIRGISLTESLRKHRESETPEMCAKRMQENVERMRNLIASWRAFEAQYPELARNMVA